MNARSGLCREIRVSAYDELSFEKGQTKLTDQNFHPGLVLRWVLVVEEMRFNLRRLVF